METDHEERIASVLELVRRIERRTIDPPQHTCLHEPEIEEVRTQQKRRWAVVLVLITAAITLAGLLAQVSMRAGEMESVVTHVEQKASDNRVVVEETRRDLVKLAIENSENIGEIKTAIGRIETKIETITAEPAKRR